ncbi:MAG: site-2 protease family protein [Acidobacteriia bacterium]|nr:site-2 protease family protein [Terriglobia bacterium]
MQAQIKLGRLFGIRIGLHYSWFIIAFLIVFSLVEQFSTVHRDWSHSVIWGTAILTAALFFVCIVLHELGHSVVAQSRGIRVPSIVLFALGGVSQMEKESPDAKSEFWMALAGPLVSLMIGLSCLGFARMLGWGGISSPSTPVAAMLAWLGYINFMLAIFNLIPGYPLDGGRVLRAATWWITGNMERSTRIASLVGQGFALLFILAGLWRFFTGEGFAGLWIAFIGWFLLDASRSSYAQMQLLQVLQGVKVRDVMDRDCTPVDANTTLQSLVDEYSLPTGKRCFVVQKNGYLAGLIATADIGRIGRDRWPVTTVEQTMKPLPELHVVSPDAPVAQALETMARENINQLPVVTNGRLEGILSRAHLLQVLQNRAELRL